MRAVEMKKPGGPEVLFLSDVERPVIGPLEVLIEVVAAGVNRPDLSQRAGRYPVPADASPILGLEVAGIVRETGNKVTGFVPGDHVMALVHGGGYADYCKADFRHLLPIPEGLSFTEAACLPEVALTVEYNMVMRAGLKSGEFVLIHGGSSGIGSHAIARAKTLGAHAITTSRGQEKTAYCKDLGADFAIDSSAVHWQDAVMEATGERGVDVILDMVAGDYTAKNLACMAEDGRYALISLQGGRNVAVDLEPVLRRRLTLTGSTLRPLPPLRKAQIVDEVRSSVLPLIASGQMRPNIYKSFALEDVVNAHGVMEKGEHLGKVVLLMGPDAERLRSAQSA
jgi:NADPH:quinone reductase